MLKLASHGGIDASLMWKEALSQFLDNIDDICVILDAKFQ